ncbi:hypothetical protein [Thiospirillum jenense]|nr:hypothetical protein [Thiospirillum jenense]
MKLLAKSIASIIHCRLANMKTKLATALIALTASGFAGLGAARRR